MTDYKVFIPTIGDAGLKKIQLRLFKERLVQLAPASLPHGISAGDLVGLRREGAAEGAVLRVDAGGEKPGWLSLSYEAAKALNVKAGASYSFSFTPISQQASDAQYQQFEAETIEAAGQSDHAILQRLTAMGQAVERLNDKADMQFSQAVRHRDDTQKGASSSQKWAIAGIVLTLLLFGLGLLIG